MERFSDFQIWNEASLKNLPEQNRNSVFKLVSQHQKGFGLWSWKMPIIREGLRQAKPNDVIAYVDVGSTFNPSEMAIARLDEYVEMTSSTGALFFQQTLPEHQWSKNELRHVFGDESDWSSGQLLGGIQILRNTSTVRDFVDLACHLSLKDEGFLLRDPDAINEQSKDFIAHRHDQSIISLLAKRGRFAVIPDETYFAPEWRKNGANFPIWATRLCSGNGTLSRRIVPRVLREIERRLP